MMKQGTLLSHSVLGAKSARQHGEPSMAAQRQPAASCLAIYGQGSDGVFPPQRMGG